MEHQAVIHDIAMDTTLSVEDTMLSVKDTTLSVKDTMLSLPCSESS